MFAVIITNVPAEITFPIGMFLLLNPAVIPAAREVCLALPPIPNPRFCLFSLSSALSSPGSSRDLPAPRFAIGLPTTPRTESP
jgi:hypothetical protein